MGLFDSVYVDCPRCGNSIEFQSKAGECVMASYRPSAMPAVIAADLSGQSEWCADCGASVTLGERECAALVSLPVSAS